MVCHNMSQHVTTCHNRSKLSYRPLWRSKAWSRRRSSRQNTGSLSQRSRHIHTLRTAAMSALSKKLPTVEVTSRTRCHFVGPLWRGASGPAMVSGPGTGGVALSTMAASGSVCVRGAGTGGVAAFSSGIRGKNRPGPAKKGGLKGVVCPRPNDRRSRAGT